MGHKYLFKDASTIRDVYVTDCRFWSDRGFSSQISQSFCHQAVVFSLSDPFGVSRYTRGFFLIQDVPNRCVGYVQCLFSASA